jgi:Pregnancy-associated plasma protein-A.
MKQFVLWLVILTLALSLQAQNQNPGKKNFQRCATDEYLQKLLAKDPGLKSRLEAAEIQLSRTMDQKFRLQKQQGNHRINSTVTIPVVVHIILPNPEIVTDADVQWQIDRLNTDFAGLNEDSVNAGPFASLFGHSNIQFCLAQRDPRGNPTNGIQRIASNTKFDQNNFNNLKYASNCGADAWDTEQYFNIWVAESTDGTLGIATFPHGGPDNEQGIVIAHEGFGNNPAYTAPNFNLGRTAVHEAGHFFFAMHIWGDGGGCRPDFPVVSGLTGSWVDDTPTQSGPTNGCPSGILAAGCGSPNPPGKMYQNYMDYTNDACYCMFTKNQVLRMEAALELFRGSLMTSDKCTPAPIFPNDAALFAIIAPRPANSCSFVGNNTCDSDISPIVTLRNYGSANLTSVVFNIKVDNNAPTTFHWTGNLAPNASLNVTLPAVFAAPGSHTLTIYVTDPNGSADGRNTNDTLSVDFNVVSSQSLPLTQGFESATFPPPGWLIINQPSTSTTWERTTLASKEGTASARIRFYDYSNGDGHTDYLVSSPVDVGDEGQVILSFDRAYWPYSTDPSYADSLAIVVSTDCGATFTEVWKRGGVELASVPGTTSSAFVPTASQWSNTKINLRPFIGNASKIVVGFKATNMFGNNLYLDNILINDDDALITDAQVTQIQKPLPHECEINSIQPVFILRNNGTDTLTKVSIVVELDNNIVDSIHWTGSLNPGQTLDVQGKNLATPNDIAHTLRAWTVNPNGMPDADTHNDTARKNFFVHSLHTWEKLYTESFENISFNPAQYWMIDSSNTGYSWEKNTKAATDGNTSMWVRNFRFHSAAQKENLYCRLLQYSGEFDSLYVIFDVSHARRIPSSFAPDTLEVLLTKDCGQTFETLYKKWGSQLATTTSTTHAPGDTLGFVPSPGQWRTEQLDITDRVTPSTKFMIVFRSTSNQDNNIFLDNIQFKGVLLPSRLKQNGFLVYPNPFEGQFIIRHITPPANLRYVVVTNAAGQTVYRRHFSGDASNFIFVNLDNHSAGFYHVKLVYSDKVVDAKLIKR